MRIWQRTQFIVLALNIHVFPATLPTIESKLKLNAIMLPGRLSCFHCYEVVILKSADETFVY